MIRWNALTVGGKAVRLRESYDHCACGQLKSARANKCRICYYATHPSGLTKQQMACVIALCEEGTPQAAAFKLQLAVKTVEFHLARARQRIGKPNCSLIHLALWAVKEGIFTV